MTTKEQFPRRFYNEQRVAAEILIDAARDAVEEMAADVRLTDAVVLLGAARDSVSDFIDKIDQRRYVQHGTAPGPTPPALAREDRDE